MKKDKVWTQEFISMTAINSMFTIIFFLFIVTITPYAKEEFNVSISTAGLAASIFVIGSLFGRLFSGGWIERYGPIRVLERSLILFIVISTCYFLVVNIESLLIVRIIQGFATGLISTATGTVSMQAIPASRRAEGISYYSSSAVIGAAIGPFVGIYFLSLDNGHNWIFTLNVLAGLASFVMLKLSKKHISAFNVIAKQEKRRLSFHRIIEVKALPISIVALLFAFCFSGVTSYLVTYSQAIQLTEVASYYFLVHATCIICTRFFTGRWIDKKGASIVIYPCLILFAGGFLLYSQAYYWWVFLLAAGCISTAFGNFNSGGHTLAVKYIEPHRIGMATATYYMSFDIGSGLGPYVLGVLIEQAGYRTMYIIVAIVALLTIPIYYYYYSRKPKTKLKAKASIPLNQI